jgi:N,N'-diacetyllegionaminate synthase
MHDELIAHCAIRNIGFFSTGFDIESIDLLHSLGQKVFKIPSGEITNLPYLRHIGELGKDVILSTGMSTMYEIEAALNVLVRSGTPLNKITVLQCTSAYPAPIEDVNLRAMQSIQELFNVSVGYSDHTLGIEIPIAAVALGASVIEKHFTMDRNLPGPDHKASLEPSEFVDMVAAVRKIETALGDGVKRLMPSESMNVGAARKTIVAKEKIIKGEMFTENNLSTKRSGEGLSPMLWDSVIGKIATREYLANEQIEI